MISAGARSSFRRAANSVDIKMSLPNNIQTCCIWKGSFSFILKETICLLLAHHPDKIVEIAEAVAVGSRERRYISSWHYKMQVAVLHFAQLIG